MYDTLWELLASGLLALVTGLVAQYVVTTYYLPTVINRYLEKTVYDPDNQKAFETYLDLACDKIVKRILGTFGGISSGVSKQMGKIEEELQADGLAQQIGNPVAAALIMKYAKKHPLLSAIIPAVISNPQMLQGLTGGLNKGSNTAPTKVSDELYK